MTDVSIDLARHMLSTRNRELSSAEFLQDVAYRWPNMNQEEFKRGVSIAQEILSGEMAERIADAARCWRMQLRIAVQPRNTIMAHSQGTLQTIPVMDRRAVYDLQSF